MNGHVAYASIDRFVSEFRLLQVSWASKMMSTRKERELTVIGVSSVELDLDVETRTD